jgi:VIT1/CCC1 family predicted Fe2+/Mn2+ transporter
VVVGRLRDGRSINLPDTLAAIDALDQAVRTDPTASREFQRSELLAGAAGQLEWAAADSQRVKWLESAATDLEHGLASVAALFLAVVMLAALPMGANRDWAWAPIAVCIGILSVFVAAGIGVGEGHRVRRSELWPLLWLSLCFLLTMAVGLLQISLSARQHLVCVRLMGFCSPVRHRS